METFEPILRTGGPGWKRLPPEMQVPFRAWPRAPCGPLRVFRDPHESPSRCITVGGYIEHDLWIRFDVRRVAGKFKVTTKEVLRRLDGTIRAVPDSRRWWSRIPNHTWWDAGIVRKSGLNRCQANGILQKPFLAVNAVDTDLTSRRKGLATRLLSAVERQTGLLPIPEVIGGRGEGYSGRASAVLFWRRFLPGHLVAKLDQRLPDSIWGPQALPIIQELAKDDPSLAAPVHCD